MKKKTGDYYKNGRPVYESAGKCKGPVRVNNRQVNRINGVHRKIQLGGQEYS